MTITQSFVDFLENQGVAIFGQDLFVRRVPNSKSTPDALYWIIPAGGFPIARMRTGEMIKRYSFNIFYRSTKAQDVEEKLFALEELLNCQRCVELEGFEVLEIEVSQLPSDNDQDGEDRETGLIQVNINTYKKEC